MYSCSEEAIHSGKPAADSKLAPTRAAWREPENVTTGTPIHKASHVVVAPFLSVWAFLLAGIFLGATRTAELRNAMILSTVVYVISVQFALPALGNHGLWLALSGLMVLRGASLGAYYPRVIRGIG